MKTLKYAKLSDPIEVVQFTGGSENGQEIVAWIRSNGRGARYDAPVEGWSSPDGRNDIPAKAEVINLRTPRGFKDVEVNDWIAKGEDGNFRSFTDVAIKEGYVAIPEPSEDNEPFATPVEAD